MEPDDARRLVRNSILRWSACFPVGLALGLLAPWIGMLVINGFLEDSLLVLLPQPIFPTIVGTLAFAFGAAAAVLAVTYIAPGHKQIAAGIIAGALGIASIFLIVVALIGRLWWSVPAYAALGVGALGCAFAQTYPDSRRKSEDIHDQT